MSTAPSVRPSVLSGCVYVRARARICVCMSRRSALHQGNWSRKSCGTCNTITISPSTSNTTPSLAEMDDLLFSQQSSIRKGWSTHRRICAHQLNSLCLSLSRTLPPPTPPTPTPHPLSIQPPHLPLSFCESDAQVHLIGKCLAAVTDGVSTFSAT